MELTKGQEEAVKVAENTQDAEQLAVNEEFNKEVEMLIQNLGAQRNGFLRCDGTVRQNLEGKLVIVGDVTADTGRLYLIFYLVNGGENRVGENHADGRTNAAGLIHVLLLVLLGRNIATAVVEGDFHVEMLTVRYGCDMLFGVQDLKLCIRLDVSLRHQRAFDYLRWRC